MDCAPSGGHALSVPAPRQRLGRVGRCLLARPAWWRQYLQFLREEKKWWAIPILVLLAVAALLALGNTATLAPFLYPLL